MKTRHTRTARRARPVYRCTFSWTLTCSRCGAQADAKGDGLLPTFPEQLPAGWVCDLGDKRAWLNAAGKQIPLFDTGFVLACPALYCSRRCARASGAKGPVKAAPRTQRVPRPTAE
ncbi:hypothetical protein AMYX_13860 [Anaeromyxobacter diazotrophicus]|uniref:Uncharacterized protein n=1 Tax=Anaeromyxobacter diazotrophicus TaxID=2590199 RepID=A0A7I9VJV0_9BACT|nr:hypothetical protein AMYX_13860 [Anaeromyxobacter diazotrophicus]